MREKQIEEMARILCGQVKSCTECSVHKPCLMMNCATILTDKGYRKQEWISVDERLPEESGVYVAYTDNGNSMTLDYSAKHKLFNSFDSYSRDVAEGFAIPVTHWMPLPEAPKMKGGAE